MSNAPTGANQAIRPIAGPLALNAGWQKRLVHVAIAATPLIAAILTDLPLCPTAATFGIPCPGCGLTRATLAALHGHFAEAFHFHPLFFFVTPLYVGVIASLGYTYVRGGGYLPGRRWNRIVSVLAVIAFALLLGVWIARFFGAFGGPVPVEKL